MPPNIDILPALEATKPASNKAKNLTKPTPTIVCNKQTINISHQLALSFFLLKTKSHTKHNIIMGISSEYTWWYEVYLFNKAGSFFLSGWQTGEANTGTLTSSAFTVGGSGFITYRLGGGKNKSLCHIEFIDASTEEVLTSTYNQKFKEINKKYYYLGYPKDLGEDGIYAANMAEYKVDLSEFLGREIKIRIVDNASNDWGLLFVDDFITYYESEANIPSCYTLAEQF